MAVSCIARYLCGILSFLSIYCNTSNDSVVYDNTACLNRPASITYTQLYDRSKIIHVKNYNDNRETTKQTRTLLGIVGVFAHKYDLDLVKVGESGFT